MIWEGGGVSKKDRFPIEGVDASKTLGKYERIFDVILIETELRRGAIYESKKEN